MKLAILGLLIVVQVLASPQRLRRDAPLLPQWDVPQLGFEARGDLFIPYRDEASAHEEYGLPHEEYGVPHEEYGPPAIVRVEPVTEHYCPEEDIVPPFVRAPPAPEALPLPYVVPYVRQEPYPAPHEDYGPPEIPHEEYGPPATPAPLPPPPPIITGPYPAPTTVAPAILPPVTLPPITLPPVTLPPVTLPPVTLPPITLPPVRSAPYPYPDRVQSHYGQESAAPLDEGLGGLDERVIVHAVRGPSRSISYIKPKIVFTKKVVSVPKLGLFKKAIFGF